MPMAASNTQSLRRIERCHTNGLVKWHANGLAHEGDRIDHVQIGTGQGAVSQTQGAIRTGYCAAIEGQFGKIRVGLRYGISNKEDSPIGRFGAQRDPDGRRVNMNAISNQPDMNDSSMPGRADHAKFAIAQLAHRIEQMRRHADPGSKRGGSLIEASIGMPQTDHNLGLDHSRDLCRSDGFRGDDDQQIRQGSAGGDQACQITIIHRPDQRRVMRALASLREMRTFQMQADKTGHSLLGGTVARRDGCDIDCHDIGDLRG